MLEGNPKRGVDGWVGVDLDGTLARYDHWAGGAIGEPVPAMVDRVRSWLEAGIEVRVVTARAAPRGDGSHLAEVERVRDWCEAHLGRRLEVTCRKDYRMVALWDDRAVQVEPNTGRVLGRVDETGVLPGPWTE